MGGLRRGVLCGLFLVVAASRARGHAEDAANGRGPWLIVPVVIAGNVEPAARARHAVAHFRRALAVSGHEVVGDRAASEAVEAGGSVQIEPASETLVSDLQEAETEALHLVAGGDAVRALRVVDEMLARIRLSLPAVNRRLGGAMHVFDLCMYGTRAYLQQADLGRAKEQALLCKRMVPGMTPDPKMHPPDVLQAFQKAMDESTGAGRLTIQTRPDGCKVYLNGRRIGRAPLEAADLASGEYAVQADCARGGLGRIHIVKLGQLDQELVLDAGFEAALSTRPGLVLRYPNRKASERLSVEHAATLAGMTGAGQTLLLVPAEVRPGAVDAISVVGGRVVGRAQVEVDERGEARSGDLEKVLEAVVHRRRTAFVAKADNKPPPGAGGVAPAAEVSPTAPWGPLMVGIVGAAGLAAGTVMLLHADANRREGVRIERRVLEEPDAYSPGELELLVVEGRALNDRAREQETLAAAGFVVGGLASVAALAWYLAWPPDSGWGWAASPLPSGLLVHGRF